MNTNILSALLAGSMLCFSIAGTGNAAGTDPSLNIQPEKEFIQQISNVVYAQVPDRGYPSKAMTMDILMPADNQLHPAIIYINGGGFISANKDGYIQHRLALAEHGYVVASITYRVAPTSTFPAPLEDVKSAIRYLRANAETYYVDAKHIGVIGGSAGGYLAAMAGTTNGVHQFDVGDNLQESSDVQAVVDLYGVSDLTQIGSDYSADVQQLHRSAGATEALWLNGSPVFGGIDGGIAANPEGAKAANPMTYISEQTPPFLLMHGDADTVVSPSQTEILQQALESHHIEATRCIVKNAGHGGIYWVQPDVINRIIAFFDAHLK